MSGIVEFDAVIVPGGHAEGMLASAGVATGKKVTSFFSIKDDMPTAAGQWFGQRGRGGWQFHHFAEAR